MADHTEMREEYEAEGRIRSGRKGVNYVEWLFNFIER